MPGGTFIQLQGSSSSFGKIGITDTNGEYTYYSTLSSAVAASVAGDTIVFFTDITETGAVTVTLPDGVDINLNGFTYTLNNVGTNNSIQTTPSATNNIFNGTIDRVGGAFNLTDSVALRVDTSTLYLNGVVVRNSSGTGIYVGGSRIAGSYTILAITGINADTSASLFESGKILSSGNAIESSASLDILDFFIESNGEGILTTETVSLYNSVIIALGGSGINTNHNFYGYNSTIVSTGNAVVSSLLGIYISNCVLRSVASITLRLSSGHTGGIQLYNSNLTSFTNTIIDIATTGTVEIVGNSLKSITASAINGIRLNTSSANLIKICNNYVYVVSSNTVTSTTGILLSTSSTPRYEVIDNNIEIFSTVAGSRCLSASGSVTAYYSGNAFKISSGQPPVGSGITQGMINTPDLYGNILIG